MTYTDYFTEHDDYKKNIIMHGMNRNKIIKHGFLNTNNVYFIMWEENQEC